MRNYHHSKRRDCRLCLTAAAAIPCLTGMAVSVRQHRKTTGAIPNFGKVNENYYRGSQPSAEQFTQLKARGIRTVIDLRKDSKAGAQEQVHALGMKYFNLPLKASRAATEEKTNFFLQLVNDPDNWPVYVHCKGGRHRP